MTNKAVILAAAIATAATPVLAQNYVQPINPNPYHPYTQPMMSGGGDRDYREQQLQNRVDDLEYRLNQQNQQRGGQW
jgi:hypothetical protein